MGKISFYYIDKDYLDFLKNAELKERGFTCVPNIEYANNEKFFFGAVLNVHGINYYVPISSKTKGKQDDILIKNKKGLIIASMRFSFMIPVPNSCLERLVLGSKFDEKQNIRIKQELAFCNRKRDDIEKAALRTYNRITTLSIEGLNNNSCDFKLLEKAYIIYCYENGLNLPDELKEQYPEITKNDTEQSKIEPSVSQSQQQSDSIKPKEKSSEKRFTITRKKFNENVQKVSRESSEQSAALQTKSRKRSTGNPNGSGNPDNR